jgi:hypothetical protein
MEDNASNEKSEVLVKESNENQQMQNNNITRDKTNLSDKKDLSNEILYFSINQESK